MLLFSPYTLWVVIKIRMLKFGITSRKPVRYIEKLLKMKSK